MLDDDSSDAPPPLPPLADIVQVTNRMSPNYSHFAEVVFPGFVGADGSVHDDPIEVKWLYRPGLDPDQSLIWRNEVRNATEQEYRESLIDTPSYPLYLMNRRQRGVPTRTNLPRNVPLGERTFPMLRPAPKVGGFGGYPPRSPIINLDFFDDDVHITGPPAYHWTGPPPLTRPIRRSTHQGRKKSKVKKTYRSRTRKSKTNRKAEM